MPIRCVHLCYSQSMEDSVFFLPSRLTICASYEWETGNCELACLSNTALCRPHFFGISYSIRTDFPPFPSSWSPNFLEGWGLTQWCQIPGRRQGWGGCFLQPLITDLLFYKIQLWQVADDSCYRDCLVLVQPSVPVYIDGPLGSNLSSGFPACQGYWEILIYLLKSYCRGMQSRGNMTNVIADGPHLIRKKKVSIFNVSFVAVPHHLCWTSYSLYLLAYH